ncbi:MAG: NAD(P)-binding domain-containing protein [Verrucomicrobia bacterium]|nr:NAD(P)-binding domain-containing protein [Verrucomicrobiota bacterium]MDA1067264.1 NAD(P)-binding domain-containing protein [Verrucomicrobiota bacterium]
MIDTLKVMFGKKVLGPSYPDLPVIDDHAESNIPGLFVIGDISGTALIKMTINQGFKTANEIASRLKGKEDSACDYQVTVIGCGCAGMGSLRQLHKLGINSVGIDARQSFQTIRDFTKGKPLYLEPVSMEFEGGWELKEGTKETLLEQLDQVVTEEQLPIRSYEKIDGIERKDGRFLVTTNKDSFTSQYVILAIGKSGNPRKAGVPGEKENAEKILHRLIDPADYQDQDLLIYGGGDVAMEAAIALAPHNRVTLVTIDKELIFPKKRNIDKLRELEKAGQVSVYLNSALVGVGEKDVGFKTGDEEPQRLPNDTVFEMIGAELPIGFLKQVGIRLESQWTSSRWTWLGITSLVVYTLYAWKKGFWPFPYQFGIKDLPGILSHPSLWYSLLYTFLMTYFGLKAMKRWNLGGKDTYQTYRFASLICFQIISFLGVEVLAAVFLPQHWWRFYAWNNPFPLLFDSFYNWSGSDQAMMQWIIIGIGALITFVVIPISVRWHGKRFCTWICGCGGLAETFGDRWRHLAPKGVRSQKWETVGTIIMFWAFISAGVILFAYGGNTGTAGVWHGLYALIVDFWLVAVIPVALYPFFGGKVWCRMWCPLAKYMQILSKWYGTLQISSNEKCISCTQCSTYCQVGVDVMAFAKNGEAFDNTNSSCIHCGICITVCPMEVLSFDNDARKEKSSAVES